MNTGLQDSYNLAWKIAMVLNGTAPRKILDSYDEERIPIADQIIKFSAQTLDSGVYQGWLSSSMKRLKVFFVPFLSRYLPKGSSHSPIPMVYITLILYAFYMSFCSDDREPCCWKQIH
jgi:2-polyprenyl-6-methoxyphenol hydroxylase-like FAD-dependent oxidoreductase